MEPTLIAIGIKYYVLFQMVHRAIFLLVFYIGEYKLGNNLMHKSSKI